MHDALPPSPWVVRFAPLIRLGGTALDVACGRGRHARLLAGLGYRVEAVDRDADMLASLRGIEGVATRRADLEAGPWPYAAAAFDGIVVVNYLHRPRFEALLDALKPGGVLIYETFMMGNEAFGKPSNPDFLLRPHELFDRVRTRMTVVAFEQGRSGTPPTACVQRLCAVMADAAGLPP